MANRLSDCPTKEWLQDNLYTYIGNRMKSNVMMVSGPSIKRHIGNAFEIASTPKAEIYLVEEDSERMAEMANQFYNGLGEIPADWPKDWQNKIHLVYGDVAGYETAARINRPVRFEYLDMYQTMPSIQYLVGHRLLKQSKLGSKLRKCMLITSSLSRCELDETLTILHHLLSEILGIEFEIWPIINGRKYSRKYRNSGRDSGVREYSPYIKRHGRLLKGGLRLFSYRDRAPMFTCMILYI